MHVLYMFALRCPSGRQKFALVSLLTKHSEVSGGSNAADRINKSNFRGRCGTVNYHTLLNL